MQKLFSAISMHFVCYSCVYLITNVVNCLEFMDRAVGLRELPNVTVLDQIEVKNDHLLVVLSGNPFIDAMESEKQREKRIHGTWNKKVFYTVYSPLLFMLHDLFLELRNNHCTWNSSYCICTILN